MGNLIPKNFIQTLNLTFSKRESVKNNKRYLFWEVNSKKNRVYLVGSAHLGLKSFYPLNDTIENAFNNSSTLVVEANTLNSKNAGQLLIECEPYNKDTSVRGTNSPEVYKLVRQALIGIPKCKLLLANLENLKPWYVFFNLPTLFAEDMGYSSKMSFESYFLAKAKNKKTIIELETINYQFNLFSSMDSDVYKELLKNEFSNFSLDKKKTEIKDLISAVIDGDEIKIDGITRNNYMTPFSERYYKTFIENRNRDMANKIEGLLNTKNSYFIVVGAAHLVGNNGVINLLKTNGYRVNRL